MWRPARRFSGRVVSLGGQPSRGGCVRSTARWSSSRSWSQPAIVRFGRPGSVSSPARPSPSSVSSRSSSIWVRLVNSIWLCGRSCGRWSPVGSQVDLFARCLPFPAVIASMWGLRLSGRDRDLGVVEKEGAGTVAESTTRRTEDDRSRGRGIPGCCRSGEPEGYGPVMTEMLRVGVVFLVWVGWVRLCHPGRRVASWTHHEVGLFQECPV